MKSKEIRHNRVVQVRNMVLRGAKRDEIMMKILRWGVSRDTAENYLEEAVLPLQKIWEAKKNAPL